MKAETAAAIAAGFSALAGFSAVAVAVTTFRAAGPLIHVYLRREGTDLIIEVTNRGRGAATLLRVSLAETVGRGRRDKLHDRVWLHSGPTPDGNVPRYRLEGHDAQAWTLSSAAVPDSIRGRRVRGYVQLGSGRIIKSSRRRAVQAP